MRTARSGWCRRAAPHAARHTDPSFSAPHGGIFVFFAINGILMFIVGLIAGTLVGAAAVVIAKSIGRPKVEELPEDAVDLGHAHVPHAAPVTEPARA